MGRSIMASLDKKCSELKNAYDSCFNTWFAEKFLKGNVKDPCPCEEILKAYSDCVKEAMKARNMDPEEYAAHWERVAREAKARKEFNEKSSQQKDKGKE